MSSALLNRLAAAARDTEGTFCCGGSIKLKAPLKLFCADKAAVGKTQALVLPMPAPDADMPELLAMCRDATFGMGSKDVLDPAYRSALCLDPDSFSCNFSLEEHGILDTIKTLMMPNALHGSVHVAAQLYKLNVYRPGDFFRAHVDTPRGAGMFGSLVVCLPQGHGGGQLKVCSVAATAAAGKQQRSQEQPLQAQQSFDWGPGSGDPLSVQWAAFYSDCSHEILPVESGYRITLTYNLSTTMPTPAAKQAAHSDAEAEASCLPGLSSDSMAFCSELKAALADPDFLPSGGELGFGCQHAYPHTQEGLCEHVPSLLKGGDAAVLAVARALGLKAAVKAVHDVSKLREMYSGYSGDEQDREEEGGGMNAGLRIGDLAPTEGSEDCNEDMGHREMVRVFFGGTKAAHNVTWCRDPSNYALQLVHAAYGNESSTESWYSAAAILVTVPEWGSHPLRQEQPSKAEP